ncbi:MAG: hypothetical protein BM557_02080 [Flavobacterium sp. MedPE-SWcel]|uniref:Cap15 family cyclic dinucleotide receptor domain-containing protein n=1 Tax=uncultured Flavobacterium sp. TaxID=165435 RepID=UPI0009103FA5|nr:hypothetical protein [uncultured Flavobacterium sp.]OIQ22186.1 MAG: hypothetical protein BM557_02080 [Flavobacterium sp. MedPE-SWcel]
MEKDYFKYYKPSYLIVLIIAFFVVVYLAKEYWVLSVSILSLVSFLILIVTEYLWRYPPFKYLFWIDDFSGRYEGKIVYQYKDNKGNTKTGKLDHVKIISQKGSKISVSSFTKKTDGVSASSLSVNKGMYVEKTDDDKHYNLIYNYLNDGSKDQGFPPHYGTEIIKFIKKGNTKILSGGYYTDRTPFQTRGNFEDLKWVSNDLEHEF